MKLEEAVSKVSYDFYTISSKGNKIPQTSNPLIISSMLNLLEISEGQTVLEIGTGSGYSTALLANLVGSSGKVVSIDIVQELVSRASQLFEKQGLDFVKIIKGDGRKGYVNDAPYDRIVVWAASKTIPLNLVEQLSSNGIIVFPIKLYPHLDSTAIVSLKKVNEALVGKTIIRGGFVNLTDKEQKIWMGPYEDADLLLTINGTPYLGLNSDWVKALDSNNLSKQIHRLFYEDITWSENIIEQDLDLNDFKVYLLAKNPKGLTTMFSQKYGSSFGYSQKDGFALISLKTGKCFYNGNSAALEALKIWMEQWKVDGNPGYEQLQFFGEKTNDGWKVSFKI